MKNLTLTIRAVYAAFSGVCGAFCASFLNLKGGGGAENERPLNGVCARLRVRFGGIFRPVACV